MVGGIIIANSIDCAPKWGKDRNVSAAFAMKKPRVPLWRMHSTAEEQECRYMKNYEEEVGK